MRQDNRSLPAFCLRSLWSVSIFVTAVMLMTELRSSGFFSNAALAAAPNISTVSEAPAAGSTSSYRWNLKDETLPLLSLPDQMDSGFEFSLTYSMDQFEFPLFQSLYYNQRAGKYILLVIPKEVLNRQAASSVESRERRTEFINLAPVTDQNQLQANGNSSLRLIDKGNVKLLTTSDETLYIFDTLADGELHCSRIKNRDGDVISVEYTADSSIKSIADGSGRLVSFTYTNHYLSSISQTWRLGSARLKKTWAIADEVRYAHRPAIFARSIGAVSAKHIPSNAITPNYTDAMMASDSALAAIFGGPGAVAAANGFEPAGLGSQYPVYRGDLIGDDGKILRGHLSFAMHLYGSEDATRETEVYVPAGFASHSREPSPTDAVITFYYPRLGNLKDVTLAVFHVANFGLSYEGERVRIGNIGGPGGSVASYKHSHLEFYRGNTGLPASSCRVQLRIDPISVFTTVN
jgi:hypothetical protein